MEVAMETTIISRTEKHRNKMLRKPDEMFKEKRKNTLPWLKKLTSELDLEVTVIEKYIINPDF